MVHGMDAFAGAIGVSDFDGKCSPVCLVCTAKINCNLKFVSYYIRNMAYQNIIQALSTGIRERSCDFRWSKLAVIDIILPSIEEQERIINFLDEKCADILKQIEIYNKQIQSLKQYKQSIICESVLRGVDKNTSVKETGIRWIGKIPSKWSIIRGKNILQLMKREYIAEDEVITCFRDGEVTLRKNRREEGFTFSIKEVGYQGVKKGDLVVHGMDAFAGAIGISDSDGKCSPVCLVCTAKIDCNLKYINYFLRNMAYQNIIQSLSTGIRERSCDFRWSKLAETFIVVPQLDEQEKIADYLDKKCEDIDKAISIKQGLIEKLNEYKKSLIYEAVTGKIEI